MKFENLSWPINQLLDQAALINLRPKYQRMPVWTTSRKLLLLDSIFNNYDLPKFYFLQVNINNRMSWEVVDGQQRINTIVEFANDVLKIPNGTIVNGIDISGKKYSELVAKIKKTFDDYTLTINEIRDVKNGEVNELFARLQKGVPLKPVELRHALYSEFGYAIDDLQENAIVTNFFENSKIRHNRYNFQDYLDHIAVIVFASSYKDIKSETMMQLYSDFANQLPKGFKNKISTIKSILKKMSAINLHNPGIFKNKWSFVDAFYLLLSNESLVEQGDEEFGNKFHEFNALRIEYRNSPETILRARSIKGHKDIYNYIMAFEKEAALKASIEKRKKSLENIFNQTSS